MLATSLLASSAAHADLVPPGAKGVPNFIRVEGDVPAGKALVVGKTFRYALVLKPGVSTTLEWHPLSGKMQLQLVDAKDLPAIEAAVAKQDNKAVEKALATAVPCGEPFQGVRTVKDTNPEAGVRLVFKVSVTGATCAATQLPNELLDADGHLLGAPAAPSASAPPAPPPASSAPAPAPSSAAPPPKSGCGACAVGGDSSGFGGLAALGLAAMAMGRRRRR